MIPGPLPRRDRMFLELFVSVALGGFGSEASTGPVQKI